MADYNTFNLPNLGTNANTNWWQNMDFGSGAPSTSGTAGGLGFQNFSGIPNWSMSGDGSAAGAAGQSQLGIGWNMPTLQLGAQGLSALGGLWNAWQSNKLAKEQLNFTKQYAQANLANQTKSYNTALTDRATSRGVMEGWTPAQVSAYVDTNKLKG